MKKTASLFAACCQIGAIMADQDNATQTTLREFGLNFGIAFQIIDDCKDVIGEKKTLGKRPGQDVVAGDITLPLLNLLKTSDKDSRKKICTMLESQTDKKCLKKIRGMFVGSHALNLTQQTVLNYVDRARNKLVDLEDSVYKNNLSRLADYIIQS